MLGHERSHAGGVGAVRVVAFELGGSQRGLGVLTELDQGFDRQGFALLRDDAGRRIDSEASSSIARARGTSPARSVFPGEPDEARFGRRVRRDGRNRGGLRFERRDRVSCTEADRRPSRRIRRSRRISGRCGDFVMNGSAWIRRSDPTGPPASGYSRFGGCHVVFAVAHSVPIRLWQTHGGFDGFRVRGAARVRPRAMSVVHRCRCATRARRGRLRDMSRLRPWRYFPPRP